MHDGNDAKKNYCTILSLSHLENRLAQRHIHECDSGIRLHINQLAFFASLPSFVGHIAKTPMNGNS